MDEIMVGLDIGTTKTCAVIGRMNDNKGLEIIGVGVAPSNGLKNGVIVNIDNTTASIKKAIEDAELMAGYDVSTVCIGISGSHIESKNSRGVVAVSNKNSTITEDEIKRVVEASQAIVIPADRDIMHVLSKEFAVNDQTGIKDPVGMTGVRLEAEVHIITGLNSCIQNLMKAVDKAGFAYHDVIFNPLASAEAVLGQDEKELGVALVDIGGGTTDILVFFDGGVTYSAVLPVGGMHVTNDISVGVRTPLESAEMIKRKFGCAFLNLVDPSEVIEVPSVGGRAPRRLFRQELTQIIEPRVTEIMEMVAFELTKSGKKDNLAAGVVLTGGTSMIDGCIEAAESVLNMPVRIAIPRDISGLKDIVSTPQYVNGVGLLKYGIKMSKYRHSRYNRSRNSIGSKIKKIIKDLF